MSGTNTASQVPGMFDVIIDGYGYVFWTALLPNMPFHVQRAAYGYTPTFIERQNTSGSYGDNEQDFFLTGSQNDWSGGTGQRFLRLNDANSKSRYFAGDAVYTTIPGQVTLRRAMVTSQPAAAVKAVAGAGVGFGAVYHQYATATNLYSIDQAATVTSLGTHGAGTPNQWGLCVDPTYSYLAGATTIRKYNGAFSDFGTNANAGSIAFLNNALYSCDGSVLKTYDGSGSASTVFTWKDATNTALSTFRGGYHAKLLPFGNQLAIFHPYMIDRPELWLYDGSGTSRIAELPESVLGYDIIAVEGVAYLSGTLYDAPANGALGVIPVIYAYLNGSIIEVWRGETATVTTPAANLTSAPTLGTFSGRLVFHTVVDKKLREYDPASGAVSTIGTYTTAPAGDTTATAMSSTPTSVLLTFDDATPPSVLYPSYTAYATTGTVSSSLIDFDSSLNKTFRGVKIEWTGTGSVDIYYQIDTLTGAYTLLQTGAVSGTEYLWAAGTTGRAVSVRLQLNNSAGSVPTVTRMYVRAAPVQQAYRRQQYVIDLTGRIDRGQLSDPVVLRDGTTHTLTGAQMATNLRAAITSAAPVSITDRLGTYTGILEPGVSELDEVRPAEYVAQVTTREV